MPLEDVMGRLSKAQLLLIDRGSMEMGGSSISFLVKCSMKNYYGILVPSITLK